MQPKFIRHAEIISEWQRRLSAAAMALSTSPTGRVDLPTALIIVARGCEPHQIIHCHRQ
jgi:hypothetical protein